MGDRVQRNKEAYDAGQVLLAEQTFVGSVVTGTGINVGVNMRLDIAAVCRGDRGNADNVLAITIEESDDNSSFTTLQVMGSLTDTNLEQLEIMLTTKPWVRAKTAAVTGTTPSFADTEVYIRS